MIEEKHPQSPFRAEFRADANTRQKPGQNERKAAAPRFVAADAMRLRFGWNEPVTSAITGEKIRSTAARNALPCKRLARLATWLVVNASQSESNSASCSGESNAAVTNGSAARPSCSKLASRNKINSSRLRTSPCCHAASRPEECAKPPVGNAESTSCQ